MKTCSKCGIEKPFEEFYKNKARYDGYCGYCKECDNEKGKKYHSLNRHKRKEYRERNKERINFKKREYYLKNKEYINKIDKEYRQKNNTKIKEYQKEYRDANKEKRKIEGKKYWIDNKEKINEQRKEYRVNNKEKIQKYHREYYKIKLKINPNFKLNRSMGYGIWDSLRGNKNGKHWETFVDYTQEDLRVHLENQFKDGMTWENYGKWQVDHKIPKSIFNITTAKSKGFKKCWNLNNLQPMWAEENNKKNNSLFY